MIFSGKRPKTLGVKNRLLAPCPSSPNCVSSLDKSDKHAIEPFQFSGDPAYELTRLKNIISEMKGMTIITLRKDYLYVECKTPIMGFVDDLEFYWDSESDVCQVRSASRLGYRDFGKNRSRVEEIRQRFNQQD